MPEAQAPAAQVNPETAALQQLMANSQQIVQQATVCRQAHTKGMITGAVITVAAVALGGVAGWFLRELK